MGGAASKYKVHPGRDDGEGRRKRALLDQNHVSASVVTMIKKDSEVSRFYREKEQAVSRIGMSEEEKQAVATIEDLAATRSKAWLEKINTAAAPKPFKDPELMFLTRPQRLRLEHMVNNAYHRKQQQEKTAGKPAPYWSIVYTDEALIRYCDTTGTLWDGPRSREENAKELRKHSGNAFKTEDYFLSRQHRRELEMQVELGFKRNMPNVRMPQLSLRYTDKLLLELAGSIDGLLIANIPTKPPREVRSRSKPTPNSGPTSASDFEVFVEPVIEEYLAALPATGAAVTLVVNGDVIYCKGFGHTGRMDKLARNERRARKEAERQARARARELRNSERAAERLRAEEEAEEAWAREQKRLADEALRAQGLKTPEEIEQERKVRALFKAVDKDGSGSVTPEELRGAMAAFGLDPHDPSYASILEQADEDGDGAITVDEFLAAFEGEDAIDENEQRLLDAMDRIEKENPTRRKIRAIFGGMDDDNSGYITRAELRAGLLELGVPDTKDSEGNSDMDTLMMAIDADGDGRVGVDEFLKAFKSLGVEKNLERERKKQRRRRAKEVRRTRKLAALFEEFDVNKDGVVDTRELWEGCHRFGLTPDVEQIKLMVARADNGFDGAGHLKLTDFIEMFNGVESEPPRMPELVGWERVERALAKISLALQREQYEVASNFLRHVAEQLVSTDSLIALAMMLGEDRAEAHCNAVAAYEQDMRRWLDDKNEVVDSSEDSEEEERKRQEEEEQLAEQALQKSEREVRKRAQRMFKEIDADKSGHLDRGEVLELARAMDADPDGDGGGMGPAELESAMAELDPDGSGKITFEEFYLWWKRHEEGDVATGGERGGSVFGKSLKGFGKKLSGARAAGGNAIGAKEREGTLRVRIISGRGIAQMDSVGGCDPYCTLAYGKAAFKTKTRKNTLKPIFGEAFAFQVTDRDAPCVIQLFDNDPMDADDLIGQIEFTPEDVLKGGDESLAGERWWTVEEATGGVSPDEVAVDWAGKGVSDLKAALKERGLAEELASDPEDQQELRLVLLARLSEIQLGEIKINAAFFEEGEDEGGWDDDDDPEDTDSDEDELWEAVAEEMAGGRRPLDCQTKYTYKDVRGGELPADGWTKDEERALDTAVKKFAEPVSPDYTSLPVGGISRVVTSLAALQLAENGQMSLKEDINKIATADVVRHKYAQTLGSGKGSDDPPPTITAAMLMTGSSGIDHKWTGIGGNGQHLRFTGQRDQAWANAARCSCGGGVASVLVLLMVIVLGGPPPVRKLERGMPVYVSDEAIGADGRPGDGFAGSLGSGDSLLEDNVETIEPMWEESSLVPLIRVLCVLGVMLCIFGVPTFSALQRRQAAVPEWVTAMRVLCCGYKKLTLEETAREMQRPVLGTWLELYFPSVVYEPGTIPGCFMYGYALLGHAIETKANRPFWHQVHYKLLAPMGMAATSYGGAHLPDPGPDAMEQRQRYATLENRAARRDKEMAAMAEQLDSVKEQLRVENDPKMLAKKQKSGAMALVGVTNGAQRKLMKMEEKHAERYEILEKERQEDDAIRDELEEDAKKSMTAIAGSLPQKRPKGWKGAWPPRRWQGHTSYSPIMPTTLWNHGPAKYRKPEFTLSYTEWIIASVQIAIAEFLGSIQWRLAAWRSVLHPGQAEADLRKARALEREGGKKIPGALLAFMETAGQEEDQEEILPAKPKLMTRRQKYCRLPSLAPAIGMHTNARDMGKLLTMLLKGRDPPGRIRGKQMLHECTLEAGLARYWSPHPSLPGMTLLGFSEMYHGYRRYLICDGCDPASGSCATLLLMPEQNVGVFLAFNCCGHGAAAVRPTFAERFLDYYFPVNKEPPPPVPEDEDPEDEDDEFAEFADMMDPDDMEITASITHGTVAGQVKHGGGISDAFQYASGLQGVEQARESTVLDPEALRKQAQERLEREEKERLEQEAKALAQKEAREEERLALMEAGGDPEKAKKIAQRREQQASKKNKKNSKRHKKDTDVAVKTSWFDNYFEDYADAMRE